MKPWRAFEEGHAVHQFATMTFIRGGLIAIGITLLGGILAALYSMPSLAPSFQEIGLDLRQLRPIHTVFASAWVFLGGVAVVHRYLQDCGPPTLGDRWRLRVQVASWAAAGVGILVTLSLGIGSGREYVGFILSCRSSSSLGGYVSHGTSSEWRALVSGNDRLISQCGALACCFSSGRSSNNMLISSRAYFLILCMIFASSGKLRGP